jgi:serine/threonine protein kinase/Tol biopolymer transport system component
VAVPQQLNHYRVISPLAKGGMGEVFVAEDTRLHRKVALKVLSGLTATDPERRLRFEREAQAVAALNHPNIVTIHSVEEADGVPFLTMELVEGKPLGETIPARGLPVDAVLRVGIAIADAIAAAHQRGITHRDLKPANVVITPEGRIKVLDFGLAKLRDAELADSANDVTRMPTAELTGEGRIIGTVSYMSPEQAEGKPVDHRTDIFSLGVMLHEMTTGERPFRGDTNVSIISAILKDTPSSITDINPALPAGLARVIRKALAKDPSRRYQAAADLRNDLEELKQELDSGVTTLSGAAPAPARRASAVRWLGMLALAAAALVAIVFAVNKWLAGRSAADPVPSLETAQMTRLTSSGNAFLAALSPDGRYVAHVKNEGTQPSLWLRQTATVSDVRIVPPAQMRYDGVAFSPDGNYVYYSSYEPTGGVGTVFRVPALGGTPQRVIEDVDSRVAFSPDGQRFTFVRGAPAQQTSHLMIANADGTDVKTLATQGGQEQFAPSGASWSPDGRTIVVPGQSLEGGPHGLIFAVDLASGRITELPGIWSLVGDLAWLPDGRSILAVASEYGILQPQLWQVQYPSGEARRVTSDLNTYATASLSLDAKSIVTVQAETISNLWVTKGDGSGTPVQITKGRNRPGVFGLDWTPDGRIVFASPTTGNPQIFIIDADGRNERQLTTQQGPSFQPSVTPDNRYVVFQRFDRDGARIWRMNLDGSEQTQLTTTGTFMGPRAGSDGFVYMNTAATGSPRPWKVPIAGGTPTLVADEYFQPVEVSPDGSQVLGVGWDVKARRSSAAILSTRERTVRLLPNVPPFGLTWAPGLQLAFALPQGGAVSIMRMTPEGKPQSVARIEDSLFNLKWSRDGKQIVMSRGQTTSDVILITTK